jgi:DNA polymerase I-like protein with 3'-5' exonuclease and polymerase domains
VAITGYITRSEGHPCHERITELPELSHTDWLALDIETTGLDHIIHTVVAVSIWDGINAYVIDVRDLDADLVGAWIRDCYSRLVVGHNVGFDLRFLEQSYGVGYPKEVYDTMIAERLLTAGKWKKPNGEHEWRTSLAAVLERRYGVSLDKSLQTSFGGDGPFSPEQLAYATEDITHLSYLCDQQQIELEEFKLDNVAEIEMSCVPIFAEMDRIGVTIHEPRLRKLIADKTLERDLLRDQIQEFLPHYWNGPAWKPRRAWSKHLLIGTLPTNKQSKRQRKSGSCGLPTECLSSQTSVPHLLTGFLSG